MDMNATSSNVLDELSVCADHMTDWSEPSRVSSSLARSINALLPSKLEMMCLSVKAMKTSWSI